MYNITPSTLPTSAVCSVEVSTIEENFLSNKIKQVQWSQEKERQSERLLTSAMNLWLLVFCNTDWSPQALKPGLGATGTKAGTTKTWSYWRRELLSNISTYQS